MQFVFVNGTCPGKFWKKDFGVLENPGIWSLQVLESPGKLHVYVCTNLELTNCQDRSTVNIITAIVSLSADCLVADRGRILAKRINVRVEHIKHSRCRQDFLDRVAENERKKKEAKEQGIIIHCKRQVLVFRSTHRQSPPNKTVLKRLSIHKTFLRFQWNLACTYYI